MERTHLERERLVFFEFDQQYRLFVMRRHDFALRISLYTRTISLGAGNMRGSTHSRPLLKLDTRSGILFRSTHISGVNM